MFEAAAPKATVYVPQEATQYSSFVRRLEVAYFHSYEFGLESPGWAVSLHGNLTK